ncbi:protein kinase domain-containing protein [Bradyrhizobium sp. SZCCHNR2012]|uniref:helix-hairpin-helix domain-containing protein n=1 Tax=Bradyrhizobium sp. SZCCHNR2012 TaxID=3057377 RepID=UPI0028F07A2E|nr:protein kinase domain-containing protein [Bradyrhizobium sp. SZCCHNR2012]
MLLPEVIDLSGREIHLDALIGQGGEGAVYGIRSSEDLVAKVYHRPLTSDRAAKIQLMSSLSNGILNQVSAWPTGLLLAKSGRAPVGLLLPRVKNAKDIHKLYSPKSRLTEFTRADWRFLVRACTNTARAFGAVHAAGSIIGDINEGSVLVAPDATVKLIDCDSFQITDQGKHYLCEVGVETFTPPELQGKNLRQIVRTVNHDSFGLAVMLFLLLFMGRHPFAGRFLGRGDMPIPKAISELRFAYSAMRADVQMDRPPNTPPLSIVGDEVAFLFERAFAKQMINGGRPEPQDWAKALVGLEKNLVQCRTNPSHWHHRAVTCPWCPMEAATRAELFPFVSLGDDLSALDLTTLWRQIEAMQSPGPAPKIQATRPAPSAEAISVANSFRRANVLAFAMALAIGGIGVFGGLSAPAPLLLLAAALITFFGARRWLDKSSDVYKFRNAEAKARDTWLRAQQEWTERAGSAAFDGKKQEVLRLRALLDYLPTLRKSKLDQLRTSVRQAQLSHYLDQFEIDKASIEGIGNGRKRTLQSYGIETAADLLSTAVENVPGFGPKLCGALYAWRQSVEARFKFNPATGVDKRDIDKIEHEITVERRKLEQAVRNGYEELRQLHARVINARTQLQGPVKAAYAEYLQADENYKAVSR